MCDLIALLREPALRLIRAIDADPPMPPFPLARAIGQRR
jgi:hypothetical protein